MSKVVALYVEHGGVYFGLDDVEPWALPEKDARQYDGPHAVVAHPPCERWGVFWSGGPSAHKAGRPRQLGDDGGCFRAAINAVRKFGGVIEHPRGTKAWEVFGIKKPKKNQGWIVADEHGGFTCCVDQGSYGHRARKPTWLYVNGLPREELPELKWVAEGYFPWIGGDGYKTTEDRRWAQEADIVGEGRYMPRKERARTPIPFRDLLLDIARRIEARKNNV